MYLHSPESDSVHSVLVQGLVLEIELEVPGTQHADVAKNVILKKSMPE